jgi:hypothetical protein
MSPQLIHKKGPLKKDFVSDLKPLKSKSSRVISTNKTSQTKAKEYLMDNTPANTDTGQKARTPYCPRIPVQQRKNWKHTQMLSFSNSYPSAIPSSSSPQPPKEKKMARKEKKNSVSK